MLLEQILKPVEKSVMILWKSSIGTNRGGRGRAIN